MVAKDVIFKISEAVQEKELAVALSDSSFFAMRNSEINGKIGDYIARYEQTRLTSTEDHVFNTLKENLRALRQSEGTLVDSGLEDKESITRHLTAIGENLASLSEIQIDEGRRQMRISQKAINAVELFTQIEIYLLVFLAITIQIIILCRPPGKA